MDPLSQAVVGVLGAAATAALLRRPDLLRPAALLGAAAGMLPDADVVIRSNTDPIIFYQYHRHFTHALLLAPIMGALVAAAFMVFRAIRQVGFKLAWLLATVATLTHGPLDAMTNYGTHLLWPFTNARESWNIISIIDPIFTFGLAGLLGIALFKKKAGWVLAAVFFAFSYWGLGTVQHHRAVAAVTQVAASRGHVPVRIMVVPTLGNLLVWRGQYEADSAMFVDGYRLGLAPHYYKGSNVALLHPSELELPDNSRQAKALDFYTHFTNGWMALVPTADGQQAVGDMRFGGLPNDISPLWGLVFSATNANNPPARATLKGRDLGQFPLLWEMVRGKNQGQPLPRATLPNNTANSAPPTPKLVSSAQCGPEVPPEFLAILNKMEAPVLSSETTSPATLTSKPDPFAGMKRIDLRPRDASPIQEAPEPVTKAHGITVYRGGQSTPRQTAEDFGIKVYRGPVSEPNKKAAQ